MKKIFFPVPVIAALLLMTGCSSINVKTEEGMQQISALQYSDALVLFEEAEKQGEDPKLIARGRGIAMLGQTDYEGAVEQFLMALSSGNGFVKDVDYDINYYLADAYMGLGDHELAEDTYTAIINLREDTEAYFLRGRVRLESGSYTLAKEDFDKVVELDPGNTENAIRIYLALADNDYREAGEEYLSAALESAPKTMSSLNKGKIYYYLGEYQTAASALEDAKNSDGSDSEAALYLGRAYEAVGEYNYASNVYQSFLARNPKDSAVYNQLALCMMKMGDYEGALEMLQAGMQTGETEHMRSMSFNEIVAYEYLGEHKKAEALITAYLAGYPDDADALREYEFLKTR